MGQKVAVGELGGKGGLVIGWWPPRFPANLLLGPPDGLRDPDHADHRAPRHDPLLQGVAPGSGAADADEQPRSGRRRAARRADRLRRQRQGGPELGVLRADRRDAPAAGERRDAPGAERQAGGGLPDPRGGAPGPDRQRPPGAAVGYLGRVPPPRGAGAHHVWADDRGVVDLHRHPGHPAGHLRDLRRVRPAALRRHPGGPFGGDRRPGRHGRRPAARGHHERRRLPRRGRGREPDPPPGGDPLLRPAGDRSGPRARAGGRGPAQASTARGGPGRQHRRGAARAGPARGGAGCPHRPDLGARPAAGIHPGGTRPGPGRRASRARSHRSTRPGCWTR